jgi:thiamine kinase-like enzyme
MEVYRETIAKALGRASSDITGISPLGVGMTNRSCIFSMDGRKYVLRMPGEGTGRILDRRKEHDVYDVLKGTGLCENVIYFDISGGLKISEFLEGSRSCNPENAEDVRACMAFLRNFHERAFTVGHSVDIFERIDFYEGLGRGSAKPLPDYEETKAKVFRLKGLIASMPGALSLTHMDAVPENFLILEGGMRLIDWEYAAMQDPLVDISLFALQSMYGSSQLDSLLESYFPEGCPYEARVKVICYMASCGLMNSNWCGYMDFQGGEFDEYRRRQYDYAREYCETALRLKRPPAER